MPISFPVAVTSMRTQEQIVDNFQQIQVEFHREADWSRFANRLKNPFVCRRERQLAQRIQQAIGQDARNVLEIGCGEGSNYLYMCGIIPGLNYVGIDFSFPKVRFLKRTFPETDSAQADALTLPFADNSFDAAMCRDLLHHVNHDRRGVLAEAVRVTRRGGKVLIMESNGGTVLNRIFRLLYPAERGMSESTPQKILEQCEPWGETNLEYLEASQLPRAIGFCLGWSERFRLLLLPFYWMAERLDRVIMRLRPPQYWAYYMVTIRVD